MVYDTVQGDREVMNYDQRISTSLTFQKDEIANMDTGRYLAKAEEMAEEIARQQMGQFYSMMGRICAKAGTAMDAGGRPFDPMMWLDGLEKLEIEFDDHGNPLMPAMIVSPDMESKVKERFASAEQSSEYRRRRDELMTRKWAEWRDREADRKLVD